MPAERYYIAIPFESSLIITLDDQETHHLVNVMRNIRGDIVEIFNGLNQLAKAEVYDIQRKKVQLKIIEVFESTPKQNHTILAYALPRLNRLETVIEKCTELDVDEFWLFPGDLSEKKDLSENQKVRIQSIIISSVKQCGRLTIPKLIFKKELKFWKKEELTFPAFFGDVSPSAHSLKNFLKDFPQKSLFVSGPEAGFSEKEDINLRNLGVTGVKLHHNILRTDTAPIVAFSLIQHHLNS